MADELIQRAADQMAVLMARRMSGMNKVQAGINSPLAESAVLLSGRIADGLGPTRYSVAISSVHFEPTQTSLFRREWDVVAQGSTFPVEQVIDLMGGWEGIDDEPVRPIQVDRFGNVNLSGVPHRDGRPGRKLMGPGPAGLDVLPNMASGPSHTLYTTQHNKQTLVEKLAMTTGYGWIGGGDQRLRSGLGPGGFSRIYTNLCVFRLGPEGAAVENIHPWVSRDEIAAATGWEVVYADDCSESVPPTDRELSLLGEVDPNNMRIIEFWGNEDRHEQALKIWRSESAAG